LEHSLSRLPAPVAEVAGILRYRLLFLLVAAFVTGAYTVLLPFSFTQRLSLENWHYLTPELAAFSIAFGLLIALTLTVQVYAMSRVMQVNGQALTVGAVIASLLPNMLCCTPIVPTLLAVFGFSTVSIYGLSGRIQSFFALNDTYILLASLILLAGSAIWSVRRVSTAACLRHEECC